MALATRILALWLLLAAPAAAEHVVLRSDRSAVVEMRTAALIMSGQQGGKLPIAVGVLPRSGNAVTVVVEIDGAAMLGQSAAAAPVAVEVFAYVLGEGLDVLEVASCAFDIDPARHRDLLAATGLKVFVPLTATSGDRRLRVLARAGDAFGLRGLELATARPAPGTAGGGGARMLGPVFHELPRPWLLAVAGDAVLPPPFGLEGTAPLPTIRPLRAPGETLVGQIYVAGKVPDLGGLRALVRSPGGDAGEVPVKVLARGEASADLTDVTVSLTLPELTSGPYEIAIALDPAAGEPADIDARSSFAPIFIDAGPAAPDAGVTEPPEPRPELGGSRRRLLQETTGGYLRSLRQLAAGDRRAALATLDASETRVARALDAKARGLLAEGEAKVFADLEDGDWGCVLPVILLHLDLSQAYARGRRQILARHASRMALDLAAAYAGKLATPAAGREAASAVTSLAGRLQERGSLSRAESLFRQALTLAEDDTARLGLATIYEKRGLFGQAVPVLEAFVAARPGHTEGRLRLALNRARLGRSEAARRALERLAAGSGDDWVTLLAHQELARLEMDEERLAGAAGILRRGLQRFPEHPTLTLQLAWVLDAQDQPLASQGLLAGLDLTAAPGPEGARSRYNRWPTELLRASRRELAATAAARLDDLGRWLESRAERK